MKIVSETSKEIKIAHNTRDLEVDLKINFNLLAVVTFPVLPLIIFVFTTLPSALQMGVARVVCDRVEPKQVDCQISQSKFFDLVQQKTSSAKFVQTAKYVEVVEKNDRDGGNIYTYKFSLISKFGEPTQFESSQNTANKIVQSVNSFLGSQQTSFKYVADDRDFVGIVALILLNLGVTFVCFKILLYILRNVTEQEIVFNKSQGRIKDTTKRFILGTTIEDYKFADVIKVDALYSKDSYDNVSFVPRISMSSGKKYILDVMSDRQATIKLVNNLNRFIGLPEEEDPVVKE